MKKTGLQQMLIIIGVLLVARTLVFGELTEQREVWKAFEEQVFTTAETVVQTVQRADVTKEEMTALQYEGTQIEEEFFLYVQQEVCPSADASQVFEFLIQTIQRLTAHAPGAVLSGEERCDIAFLRQAMHDHWTNVTDNPAADSPNMLPTDVESLQQSSQPGVLPEHLAAMIQDYPGLIQEFPSVELVRFDSDSTDIAPEAYSLLCECATALNSEEFKDSVFLIAGHADSTGSPAYNLELSERRAEAVKRVLVSSCGLDTSRLFIIGYGIHYPVASNETAQGRVLNRRVEFIHLGDFQDLSSELGG